MKKTTTPIRVLIADDHRIVREGFRRFLEQADDIQVVAEAEDGESAKRLIEEFKPDVAILDIQMPVASGIEVTRWIREKIQGLGVLILTAYDDTPYVMGVLQAGANGYILKTASPVELLQAVRDVYAGKSALDATIAHKVMAQMFDQHFGLAIQPLTEREMGVLRLTARGYTNKAIAVQLEISDRTVQGHLAHIFDKLQANSRTEAVMRAVSLGWVPQSIGNISEE